MSRAMAAVGAVLEFATISVLIFAAGGFGLLLLAAAEGLFR